MKTSNFLSIGSKDALKGFILACITVVVTLIYTGLQTVPISFPSTWAQWQTILLTGLGAGLAYLLKNFLTSSDDKFLTKEQK